MFEKGEYIYYASGGICRVDDIKVAPLAGMTPGRQYYVLHSLHDSCSVMYVPVDSTTVFVRRLLSKAEAEELVRRIPSISPLCEPNGKALRAKYTEVMQRHEPEEWVRVVKTVYQRAEQFAASSSQRLSDSERAWGADAKRYLHTELSLALEIPVGQVEEYIQNYAQEQLA